MAAASQCCIADPVSTSSLSPAAMLYMLVCCVPCFSFSLWLLNRIPSHAVSLPMVVWDHAQGGAVYVGGGEANIYQCSFSGNYAVQ